MEQTAGGPSTALRVAVSTLWLVAAAVILTVWSGIGVYLADLADVWWVHTPGPDTAPLWQAYAAAVFLMFMWPATLLVIARGKPPLTRAIRVLLILDAVMMLLGAIVSTASGGTNRGFGIVVFARHLNSPAESVGLAGLLMLSVLSSMLIDSQLSGDRTRVRSV